MALPTLDRDGDVWVLTLAPDDENRFHQDWLAAVRRLSPRTALAYGRDADDFLRFLTGHLGAPPGIADLGRLTPADFRAFLARHPCWTLSLQRRFTPLDGGDGFFAAVLTCR